jgi:transposase
MKKGEAVFLGFGVVSAQSQGEVSSILRRGLGGCRKEPMQEYRRSQSGRRYDADFKENAVALVKAGRSFKEVANDLGVSSWSLRVWLKRQEKGQPLNQRKALADLTPEQRENRRLRLELEQIRRQRDILKKALAIVSDGHLNSASNL